ncbi:MAG: nicotinate-nucleotide--dimethylbenzimidazole phosphoribosyltransferase, partial [Lentisphaeraceae bacterium]|nr:nicotinate-nucleotide--dimethylbenzimidazole phosphoribosyltransferase [Lentisphaeraceae bacterium]
MKINEGINNSLLKIKSLDPIWENKTCEFLNKLALPQGGLGELGQLAVQLVSAAKKLTPQYASKCVIIAAADHGICAEKISTLPQVTDSIVKTILNGSAAISILAKEANCDLKVVDMGICASLDCCLDNDNFI